MNGLRLLEKLSQLENPTADKADDDNLLLQSIIKHIKSLLGTHKGTVPISDDYGMPDVFFSQGIDFRQSSTRMQNAIAEVITRFETRLTGVNVELLSTREDLLKQRFRIRSFLKSNHARSIDFTVEFSSEAKITVTSENGHT